jgi:hypothetical protein|tara:strand:- start:143 stop:409 length:267 start_codon:yes stop_codon:yes gene_type:complete
MKLNDYSSLSGPENGVYCRGRLRHDTHINLPEEWDGVVNVETITVCITPIGSHQDIIVKGVQGGKVTLQAKVGLPIDCYYHIFAETLL